MPKIKVLLIDDSMVVRHMLADIISQDPNLEVVGQAANGKLGLEKLAQVEVDVVVLDIEMPVMDGLQTLPEIKKMFPRMPVIMCSTLTSKGAEATFKSLSLGASDYITKPTNSESIANSRETVKVEFIPKLILFGERYQKSKINSASLSPSPSLQTNKVPSINVSSNLSKHKIDIVTIGVSTGGPNALEKVLTALPKDFPVPIVIVQHMPPSFTKMLADYLNNKCALSIEEGKNGDVVEAGKVIIAPGGFHMALARSGNNVEVRINQDAPENSCRPAVDVLFRSVNSIYSSRCLGAILTGMGSDGLKGCELLNASGAEILAQDEATSVVWGMPGFIARAGIASAVLPLEKIAEELILRARYGRVSVVGGASSTSTIVRAPL